MAKNTPDFIVPLNINGMRGRMLRLEPIKRKKREILLVYGHHASIERMLGLAEELNKYGGVTLPDLPGFGGMDSFYKIGEKPTIDNLADYLATLIKLRFRGKKLTIIGMSFGFAVVTRMLQRYPQLAKKVDLLVSLVGFVHRGDFKFKRRNYWLMRYGASVFTGRFRAIIGRYLILNAPAIRWAYKLVADKNSKLKDASEKERNKRIDFEIKLWHINDVRTYVQTTIYMLTIDLCNIQVDLPVVHVSVEPDRYFDNQVVKQHMRVIYNRFTLIRSHLKAHAPTVVATAKDAAPFIPLKLRKLLAGR